MTSSSIAKSQVAYARFAGFMFLLVNAAYMVGLAIISRFAVPGNIAETAHRILQSELLYRLGLASLLMGALGTVFLAMGLYVAVRPIDGNLAMLALVFRIAEATIFGVLSVLNFGELPIVLWLLIWGARPQAMAARPS